MRKERCRRRGRRARTYPDQRTRRDRGPRGEKRKTLRRNEAFTQRGPCEARIMTASAAHLIAVRRISKETDDVRTFELEVPEDHLHIYKGRAGQFLRITIPGDPAHLSRNYSLSSSPELGEPLRFTVKRIAGGAVSERLVAKAEPGHLLHVDPPAGNFTLKPVGDPILLIAGGSGVTPIFSLLKTALHTTDRRIALLCANRSHASAVFTDQIDELARTFPSRLAVQHHFSDETGFISDDYLQRFSSDHPQGHIYLCGPTPLMDVVERAFVGSARSPRYELFSERFLSASAANAVIATEPRVANRQHTNITMRIDGIDHAFDWSGAGTILDAALAAGIPAPFSCREGHCGACKARLMTGDVEQTNALALSKRERERNNILVCCATPLSADMTVEID
jgi:ferredoxin-NADP reductase